MADGGARRKWVTFGVLLALLGVVVGVVALAGGGGGSGDRLVLERAQGTAGGSELLASVPREINEPSVTRGKAAVVLECTDTRGRRVLRSRQPWPFIEEEGYPLPHAHQPATESQLRRIARCRVLGTSEKLEGELSLRG